MLGGILGREVLDSFNRSFSLNIRPVEDDAFLATATLSDYFHDIRISLKVRESDLTVLEAEGSMGWIPYPAGCPKSLALLQRLVGTPIKRGISRRIANELGGPEGCPYVIELAMQLSRFISVASNAQLARRLVLHESDLARFLALRTNEMGECAGHQNVAADQLPQWLEMEKRQRQRWQRPAASKPAQHDRKRPGRGASA
jgi:hypothetical protein